MGNLPKKSPLPLHSNAVLMLKYFFARKKPKPSKAVPVHFCISPSSFQGLGCEQLVHRGLRPLGGGPFRRLLLQPDGLRLLAQQVRGLCRPDRGRLWGGRLVQGNRLRH